LVLTPVVGVGLILLSCPPPPRRVPGLFFPLVHRVGWRNIL
jgi:hypothetical protein